MEKIIDGITKDDNGYYVDGVFVGELRDLGSYPYVRDGRTIDRLKKEICPIICVIRMVS